MTTAPHDNTAILPPLALALVNHPRATLQELAKAIGISKATLYRFCPTRDLLIKRLLEQSLRTLDDAERLALRQSRSRAVIEELRRWLDQVLPTVPPSSVLGGALGYLHRQWPRLTRYLERGDLPIDNNPAENAIRPFVVGRKAWLFSDTQAGARASALIYSLVETAKANGMEPYLWLRNALRALPTATTVEHFEALLPWNLKAEHLITA